MFGERAKSHHASHGAMMAFMRGKREVKEYLNSINKGSEKGAVYIHVPFCNKICSFCNMRRSLATPVEDYAELIVKEIKAYKELEYINNSTFQSIYFGGGTPTTLDSNSLRKILFALRENLTLTEEVEISLETTVTELTSEKLEVLKEGGVNRFSIGIQTFNNSGRNVLGRVGSGEKAYRKIVEMKDIGFKNINIDLIYNYPNQTLKELDEDLDNIFSLDLGGFSFYSLIMMSNSDLKKLDLREKDIDEELFNRIYTRAMEKDFSVLELTKLVRHDEYKYIKTRHSGADTLALGAGAGGGFSNMIYGNPFSLKDYRNYVDNFHSEQLLGTVIDAKYKHISKLNGEMQQCRIPVEKYSDILGKEALKLIEELEKEEYIVKAKEGYQMTQKGIYWGNSICEAMSKVIITQ